MKFFLTLAWWTLSLYIQLPHALDRQAQIKQNAFSVLNTKCNACHAQQNPRMVFTLENMDKHARKINRQVFVLKRMPKGNVIKLSEGERDALKEWVNLITQN
jgi:uncharacterized membrane protein